MKFLVGLLCVLVLFVSVAPVEAGGNCNVQALQAFAGNGVVSAGTGYQVNTAFAVPFATPQFLAPVYTPQNLAIVNAGNVGHCGVSAFSSAGVVRVQNVRAARVRNQVVKSKAKSRVR